MVFLLKSQDGSSGHHLLDPNFLDFGSAHEYRIYADDTLEKYAVVDQQDYFYLIKYRWNIKSCRALKEYLRRSREVWENKTYIRTETIYLHIEIMKRVCPQPSPLHKIVDHRDGNEWDCRRRNLRWATIKMNTRNKRGSHPHDHHFSEPNFSSV